MISSIVFQLTNKIYPKQIILLFLTKIFLSVLGLIFGRNSDGRGGKFRGPSVLVIQLVVLWNYNSIPNVKLRKFPRILLNFKCPHNKFREERVTINNRMDELTASGRLP